MRRSHRVAGLVVAVGGLYAVGMQIPAAYSGYSATVENPVASYGSGALVLSSTTGYGTCTTTGTTVSSDSNTNCSGTLLPPDTGGTSASATTSVSDVSNLATSRLALAGGSCGLLVTPDIAGGNTAVLRGGVALTATSPWTGSSSLAFSGSTGYLESTVATANPQTFTIMGWFNTAAGATSGGTIIGDTNAQGNSGQTLGDRQLWIDPAGQVVFGVTDAKTGTNTEIASSGSYNNGAWHLAVATLTSSGPDKGMQLYVDGTNVAADKFVTGAVSYTGYWHLGWGADSSWASPPSQPYFNGNLSSIAVFPTALTGAQISTLYGAASQSAEQADITGDAPTYYWPATTIQTDTALLPGINNSFADISGSGNTATGVGEVTSTTVAPWSGIDSAALNGTTAWLQTTQNIGTPQTFTIAAWFNTGTGTTAGGTIIGDTNLQGNSPPSTWDRSLWIDTAGHVVFGVYPGSTQEIVSPGSYDGTGWHLAVATLSSAGMQLYMDGNPTPVASNPGVTSAQNYTGYWHLGWGNEVNGWPYPPNQAYFNGELSNVSVFPSALTGSQIAAIYAANTSQANQQAAVLGDSPSYYWPLTGADICTQVDLTIQDNSSGICILPPLPGSCGTPTSAVTLASLENQQVLLPQIPNGTTESLSITLSDTSASMSGLHLSMPLSLLAAAGGFTATLGYPTPAALL